MFRITNVLVFMLLSAHCFSQTATQSKRITKPVTVDGSYQEWITPFNLYEAKTKLMFSIANNDSTLYLCFQCPDPINQDKIMQAGMQVNISSKGKNKIDASIQFPLKKDKKNQQDQLILENLNGIEGIKANFLLNNFVMLTEGFANQNGITPVKQSRNILIAMNWDSLNTLVYEITIPFKELFGNAYTPLDIAKELTLNVELFAVERPDGMENANLSSLNTNAGASVVNGGGMQTYGGMSNGTGGGMQNTGSLGGINGMSGYSNNSMAGMMGMQNNGAGWDGSTTPQYYDISALFEKAELKQKFFLTLNP